jgi:hypothetical protein
MHHQPIIGVNIILPPGTLTIRLGGIKMVQEDVQMMWGSLLGGEGGYSRTLLIGGGSCCVTVRGELAFVAGVAFAFVVGDPK